MTTSTAHSDAIPETGLFLAKRWAEFLQYEPNQINEQLSRWGVPTIGVGALTVIDAKVFWKHMRLLDKETYSERLSRTRMKRPTKAPPRTREK